MDSFQDILETWFLWYQQEGNLGKSYGKVKRIGFMKLWSVDSIGTLDINK